MFLDHHVLGEEVLVVTDGVKARQMLIPDWWSEKMLEFMIELERRTQVSQLAEGHRGPKRLLRHFVPSPTSSLETRPVPKYLPCDVYSKTFLGTLLAHHRAAYESEDPIFPEHVSLVFSPSSTYESHNPISSQSVSHFLLLMKL